MVNHDSHDLIRNFYNILKWIAHSFILNYMTDSYKFVFNGSKKVFDFKAAFPQSWTNKKGNYRLSQILLSASRRTDTLGKKKVSLSPLSHRIAYGGEATAYKTEGHRT